MSIYTIMDVLLVATMFIFSNKHVYGFATEYQGNYYTCQRGHYMEEDYLDFKSAKCQACPPNTFNPFPNRSPSCQYCKNSCIAHASVTQKCTPTSDTVCHCDTGFIEKHNACIPKTECECPPGSFVDEMFTENALQSCTCKPCRYGTYNSNKDNSASCADCSHGCPVGAMIITSCNTTSDRVCACKPGYRKTRNSITSQWACVRSMDTPTNPTTTNPEYECPPGSFVDEMCTENALQSSTCKPCRQGTYNSNKDNSASCADCSHDCPVGAIISTPCNTTSDRVCVCKPGYRKTRNSITSNWACVRSMDTSTNPTTTNPDSSTNLNGERKMGRGRNVQGVPMLVYIASCCATVYITMVHR